MTAAMEQVLAVKARLMQDHPDVDTVAGSYCGGFVNRLTAAKIYVACGMRMKRCRRVTDAARSALRNMPRAISDAQARHYAASLERLCLELAARTTAPRQRKTRQKRTS